MKCLLVLLTGLIAGSPAWAKTAPSSSGVPEAVIEAALAEADCFWPGEDTAIATALPQPLGDGLMLLEIPCWMAAYQAGSILMAYDPDAPEEARLLRFPVPDADGLTDQPSLTFPDYDPETRQLTSLHRARGPGDCGTAGRWQWTGEAFTLESYWDKPDCDGELFDPFSAPETWRVYP